MLIDFDGVAQIAALAEQRVGMLEFRCDTLGLWDGFEADLDGPMRAQYRERGIKEERRRPGVMSQLVSAFSSAESLQGLDRIHENKQADYYWRDVRSLFALSAFRRAMADLSDRELSVLRATCGHTLAQRANEKAHGEFLRFFFQLNAKLVWAGGRGQFVPDEQSARYPAEGQAAAELAREMMVRHVNASPAEYDQEIGNMLGQYVQAAQHGGFAAAYPGSASAISAVLDPSSTAWATPQHIAEGQTPFKSFETGKDLLLGVIPTESGGLYPVGFAGHESLVTVAQPGAGKTQCHILPNLFTYNGSLVVLDPKCELLEKSAGHRQAEGKRILILSLADDDQPTHKFNVLEFVDQRPEFLWGSCVELAEFLIPPSPHDNSPIFRAKAAEMFAVCLGGVVLAAKEGVKTATLSWAIRELFKSTEGLKNFLNDTQDRAEAYECQPLSQSAAGLAALARNETTLEDFQRFQTNATSALSKLRGGMIDRVADGMGDWRPEDLREPGTTLYIRVPYEEMSVYGGFVRMVLYILTKRLRRGRTESSDLPITFLLDEVAQLGNLDAIANVVETGRGFGLRVWLIFQDYDQAKAATNKPNLLLRTPKVRLFMNPSFETARDMSGELGKINQIITGQDKPLAEPARLMGEAFANDIVVLSSGSRPVRLQKYFAWREESYEAFSGMPYSFTQNGYRADFFTEAEIQRKEQDNRIRL